MLLTHRDTRLARPSPGSTNNRQSRVLHFYIFGENRYPNNYMNTLVDKNYENYILDIVDRAADDYYVELNH